MCFFIHQEEKKSICHRVRCRHQTHVTSRLEQQLLTRPSGLGWASADLHHRKIPRRITTYQALGRVIFLPAFESVLITNVQIMIENNVYGMVYRLKSTRSHPNEYYRPVDLCNTQGSHRPEYFTSNVRNARPMYHVTCQVVYRSIGRIHSCCIFFKGILY